MSSGYVRQSSGTIVTGNTILASDFNNEYNALQTAFDATSGHTHSGVGQGGPIVPTAIGGLSGTGVVVATSATAATVRTITGTAAQITVTNGSGVSGNPTISLPASMTMTGITLTGGAYAALTGLGIRSSGAAFDLTLASSEVLTAGRTLSIVVGDTARTLTIGASASVSGTNTGDQTTVSGNAGTATALQNARTIGGVSFDGTGNITVATATGGFTITGGDLNSTGSRVSKGWFTDLTVTNTISGTVTNAANIDALDDVVTATSVYPIWVTAGGSYVQPHTSAAALTFVPSTGVLSSTSFTGAGTGLTGTAASLTAGHVTTNANLTGDITSSGNATTLATVNSNVGAFTNANITVNAKGLITAAASGSAGTGTVTSVATSNGITGGTITTTGTVSLDTNNSMGVGAMCMLLNNGGSVNNGSTTAGSNLGMGTWSTTGTFTSASSTTGTWRNISGVAVASNSIGFWIRTV